MYTVFDPTQTILINYQDNNFIVEDFSSRKTCSLPEKTFYGDTFKYECDFFKKFFDCFPNKKFIIFTKNGEKHYLRLKAANREGIF